MNLPMQVEPVTRAIATYSTSNRDCDPNAMQHVGGGNGIVPCDAGVDASGIWDWVKKIGGFVGGLPF